MMRVRSDKRTEVVVAGESTHPGYSFTGLTVLTILRGSDLGGSDRTVGTIDPGRAVGSVKLPHARALDRARVRAYVRFDQERGSYDSRTGMLDLETAMADGNETG